MDRKRVNAAAPRFDDELRRLVAITPSPEFEARVRARVAAIDMARSPRAVWWWVGSLAAAALILIAPIALAPRSSGKPHLAVTSFTPALAPIRPSWPSTVVHARTTPAMPRAAVEVIVQRGQTAALLQFAALTAAGRIVEPSAAPPAAAAELADLPLPLLTIAPVTVEPLASPAPTGEPK